MLRCDRKFETTGSSRGGGVLIAYKNDFHVERLDLSYIENNSPSIDLVGCKLYLNTGSILIYTLYIPPSTSVVNFGYFLEMFENIILQGSTLTE